MKFSSLIKGARFSSSLSLQKPKIESTAFFMCDIQERFKSHIYGFDNVVSTAKKMQSASDILGIPVITTEQYPKALGHTVDELGGKNLNAFPKTTFSMLIPEVASKLETLKTKTIILYGIESHVCVTHTARDLLRHNFQVIILADGVSSMNQNEVPIALSRLRQDGCTISSSEGVLFELLGDAKHPKFKQVSNLVKEYKSATTAALSELIPISKI